MKKAPEELRFAAVAVDVVIFTIQDGDLKVLISDINRPPHYVNIPGLIGGLIDIEETAEDAIKRHVTEKMGVPNIYVEQLYTFSEKERDLRNRVISVAYIGLVSAENAKMCVKKNNKWASVKGIGTLAYDHNKMLDMAVERLRGRLSYTNIARFLLSKNFTLSELQTVYEVIQNQTFDKRNFRKKILSLDVLEDTGNTQEGVRNRPAALYYFKGNAIEEISLFA